MCTVSWWSNNDGQLEVFANRDEQKSRPAAEPPEILDSEGTAYLSPRDPKGGGTWILANEHGVVLTLLNAYEIALPPTPQGGWNSRGQLVRMLASARNLSDAEQLISRLAPSAFPPFRLIGFFPSESGWSVGGWMGNATSWNRFEPTCPISSSSFETKSVLACRAEKYATFGSPITPSELFHYHHATSESPTAYSVRMNRPDAQTWSISHLCVDSESIRYRYEAETLNLEESPTLFESELPRK